MSTVLIPTHFTSYEGGVWVPYTMKSGFSKETLALAVEGKAVVGVREIAKDFLYLSTCTRGYWYKIHSLQFKGKARWDCINGWTQESTD